MADLKSIQDTLNSDPAEREKFLKDPAGYLKEHGVILPPEAEEQLKKNVQSNAGSAKPLWSVGVVVGQ